MTSAEQRAMDERIRDMKRRGIPSHVRVEILKRERAADAAARAQPETPDPAPLAQQPTRPTDRTDPVAGDVTRAPARAVLSDAGQSETAVPC